MPCSAARAECTVRNTKRSLAQGGRCARPPPPSTRLHSVHSVASMRHSDTPAAALTVRGLLRTRCKAERGLVHTTMAHARGGPLTPYPGKRLNAKTTKRFQQRSSARASASPPTDCNAPGGVGAPIPPLLCSREGADRSAFEQTRSGGAHLPPSSSSSPELSSQPPPEPVGPSASAPGASSGFSSSLSWPCKA